MRVLTYGMCGTYLRNVRFPTDCAILSYGMCGTALRSVRYCPTECAVLPYGMCGTERAYHATRCAVLS
eukprot:3199320-Rhodomonas_salina.1